MAEQSKELSIDQFISNMIGGNTENLIALKKSFKNLQEKLNGQNVVINELVKDAKPETLQRLGFIEPPKQYKPSKSVKKCKGCKLKLASPKCGSCGPNSNWVMFEKKKVKK